MNAYRIFLLMSCVVVGNVYCMKVVLQNKKKDPTNIGHLLAKNGKYLKQLIAVEGGGYYSPGLLVAEKTLQDFFCQNSAEKIEKTHGEQIIGIGKLIAQRGADRKLLWQAVANRRAMSEIEEIFIKNPYMVNAYALDEQSCLHKAVIGKQVLLVEKLLELGAHPQSRGRYDQTPLHHVKDCSSAMMFLKYTSVHQNTMVNQEDEFGATPLFYVDNCSVIDLLLLYGANINAQNSAGDTPLHYVMKKSIDTIKRSVCCAVIRCLLKKGANPELSNKKGDAPVNLVCESSYEYLQPIFIEHGYQFI